MIPQPFHLPFGLAEFFKEDRAEVLDGMRAVFERRFGNRFTGARRVLEARHPNLAWTFFAPSG